MHLQDPVGVLISQNQEYLSAFFACSIVAALPALFLLQQLKK
jgi:acyl-CoA synthetase (AMP-forming)/AMP-acid ligase II